MKCNQKYCSVLFNMDDLAISQDSLPYPQELEITRLFIIRLIITMVFNRINIFLGN